jgi:hypothetical protein
VTEQEAAKRLCTLLNEIEAAGHECGSYATYDGGSIIYVGEELELKPPQFSDGVWEVSRG